MALGRISGIPHFNALMKSKYRLVVLYDEYGANTFDDIIYLFPPDESNILYATIDKHIVQTYLDAPDGPIDAYGETRVFVFKAGVLVGNVDNDDSDSLIQIIRNNI